MRRARASQPDPTLARWLLEEDAIREPVPGAVVDVVADEAVVEIVAVAPEDLVASAVNDLRVEKRASWLLGHGSNVGQTHPVMADSERDVNRGRRNRLARPAKGDANGPQDNPRE